MGCLVAAVIAMAAAAGTAATWLAASALGIVRPGGGVRLAAAVLLLGVVLVVVRAVAGIGRLARPMRELVDAARRIEAGDLSARVPVHGPPDHASVARAFNAMSARLSANEARRRGFLADVTHELRTPLSVIRGQAEAIADGIYPGDADHVAPIVDAARTLEALVEDLRTLALSDTGNLGLSREDVDLDGLVHDTVAAFAATAEAAGIALTGDVDPAAATAHLDPARIRRVLSNLVSNALRHTRTGGSVRVAARPDGGSVVVTVADTGEGIPPELLPHVFERFVRAEGSPGSGLGLAIARDVVTAHGGSIDIDSSPGAGTTVRVSLPAAHAGS
ncbi:MAG TPA: HAMP domain-containing sensor histidine kinase [Candidatus Dormibacteraeota bacterium]|nr:HAMP domain-containing sensor histidine kinase [Candidatus Dormibacteraeota bacterium]